MPSERPSDHRRARRPDERGRYNGGAGLGGGAPVADGAIPGTTGRYLVLLREDAIDDGVKLLAGVTEAQVVSLAAEEGTVEPERLEGAGVVVFDKLGVAVVDTPPERMQALSVTEAADNPILAIEPERYVYALTAEAIDETVAAPPAPVPVVPAPIPAMDTPIARLPVEYLLGYRAAVDHLVTQLLKGADGAAGLVSEAVLAAIDESAITWGLQVTKVPASRFTGRGIRVAVLDTGFDVGHPDFMGRHVVTNSFVAGQSVQDGHGHGTHCIGTACGPKQPGRLPRYGIAYEADIYAGKVLSNQGSGTDQGILAGINWAITNRCAVISMSLGAPVQPGQAYSRVFEAVGRRALAAGTLIVAAAGNDSHRPTLPPAPVGHPANCPSFLAVGALDPQLQVTFFSNGGINPDGGQVDIAAPGLNVRSSWPRPQLYNTISGTSMATPHVAGIAALLAEANPGVRGAALWSLLTRTARRLPLSARDVGAGLVQAP